MLERIGMPSLHVSSELLYLEAWIYYLNWQGIQAGENSALKSCGCCSEADVDAGQRISV